MESLKSRLDYRRDEVLSFTKQLGRLRAMEEFEIRDYACFHNWLKEATGDENFGIAAGLSMDGRQALGDQLVAAFLRKVAQLQDENQKLRVRVEYLKGQAGIRRHYEQDLSLEALEICQA